MQFDPPDDPRDYIHRVGRTARGANAKGRSLMFLLPNEVGFLKYLKDARVPVVEFEFPSKKLVNVQSQLEKLIGENYYLNKSAKDGYKYVSTPLPLTFNQTCGRRESITNMTLFIQVVSPGICIPQSANRL